VLARRTRISIEAWDRGAAAADPVARIMAKELGWDEEQTVREIEYYRTRVQAERDSQTKLDDTTADAARLGAPDIVSLRP
jgi:glycerol-3-phosphate dehydrogenase